MEMRPCQARDGQEMSEAKNGVVSNLTGARHQWYQRHQQKARAKMATEIELTHQGGDTKEVEVFGRCGRWAFVWWPGAGMYDLDLRTGELRRGKQIVREWFASPEERERLAKLPQEAFGNGAG